jgi:tetratricopeptide (TPR) repeat protein
LRTCGRVQEACGMQGEAVNLTRTLNALHFELVRDPLAFQLHDLGTYQAILKQYPDACASFEEAIAHRSILYASDPSKYLLPLSLTLNHYTDALNSSSRSHEAIKASRKAVSLTRLAFAANPEDVRQDLAQQLYSLALYLRLGDDPEALSAAKEALELRRKMYDIAPTQHRLSLLSSIQQCAAIRSDLDDMETAFTHCEEAIKMLRALRCEDGNDATLREDLSTTLCNAAYCLAAMKCPQTAADYSKEAIELDRESYLTDPAKYQPRLIETLSDYAELLDSMERVNEASQVRNELERIRPQ